ncbi:MAG: L-threonylcarbamoyladenylate synthase [Pseudomonadota bacterium]
MDSTELLSSDDRGVAEAARLIRGGRLVAFPTETVYGLGADATQDGAVARVFQAKNRPSFNPLIVHVASIDDAKVHGSFDQAALALADAFWPGPLTLILDLERGSPVSNLVTAGTGKIALRVPDQALAERILLAANRPIAAPSANPSGRLSPTSAVHVIAGLGGQVDAVIDGGPCPLGLESTIVATGDRPLLLRPGAIERDRIEEALGQEISLPERGEGPAAPGQLAAHYAPRVPLRIDADEASDGESYLGFGPGAADANLSKTADLVEAAANLFRLLHALDSTGKPIAVAPIPEVGLGVAINDRLRRAATPKS